MTNIEAIKLILQTYRFDSPVPAHIRSQLFFAKKQTLVFILTKYGKYTLFAKAVIKTFLYFREIGFGISMAKSAAVVISAAAITACAVILSGALITQKIIHTNSPSSPAIPGTASKVSAVEPPTAKPAVANMPASNINNAGTDTPAAAVATYKVEITEFTADPLISRVSAKLKNDIYTHLTAASPLNAVLSGKKRNYNSEKKLVGSIMFIEDVYTINVRLVDMSNSTVLTGMVEKCASQDELDLAAKKIADRIAPYLK